MKERGLNQECLIWGKKKRKWKKLKFILSDLSPDALSNLHPLSQKAAVPIKSGQYSHTQSFLLLYLNSNARKDFREYLSTPASSFYREKTESQRVTCPRSHTILKQALEVYFGPIIITFLPHQLYQLIFIEYFKYFLCMNTVNHLQFSFQNYEVVNIMTPISQKRKLKMKFTQRGQIIWPGSLSCSHSFLHFYSPPFAFSPHFPYYFTVKLKILIITL